MTKKYEYRIFPTIGIARVGNSDEFYIAPEVPGGLPIKPEQGEEFQAQDFWDSQGRLRRQAARFRIYRYDPDDETASPEEVLPGTRVKAIQWTVHIANKKASWYESRPPYHRHPRLPSCPLRNALFNDDRKKLIIDPGARTITGTGTRGDAYQFARTATACRPTFPPRREDEAYPSIDTLGELQTDSAGRLLILGGLGRCQRDESDRLLMESVNNHGWWDDTSDGSVNACIVFEDGTRETSVVPAWVVVAPPSYAPQIVNLVTAYDVIFDVMVRKHGCNLGSKDAKHTGGESERNTCDKLKSERTIFSNGMWNTGERGYKPDFDTEIKPILERAQRYRWVVKMPWQPHDFDFEALETPRATYNAIRKHLLDALRTSGEEDMLVSPRTGRTKMPYMVGNNPSLDERADANYLCLTDTQYFMLQQWASGHFVNPRCERAHAAKDGSNEVSAVSTEPGHDATILPDPSPEQLTRAALDGCLGASLAPGIEIARVCREPGIYDDEEPFRIKCRKGVSPQAGELSLGLDIQRGLEPGDLTRGLALPWHTDFNSCSIHRMSDERVLWWWPAQRPLYVHPQASSDDVQRPWIGQGYDARQPDFLRFHESHEMVENWSRLPFVISDGADGPNARFVSVVHPSNVADPEPGGD